MPRRVDPAKIHQRYITRSVRDLLLFYGRQLVGWRFFLSSFFIDYMKDRCSTAGQINFIAPVSFGWLHSHRMFSSNIKPSLRSCWSRSRPQINRHFHVNPPNNGPQISRHGNRFSQLRSEKAKPLLFSEAFLSNRAEPERQPVTVDKLKYTSFVLSGQRRNSFLLKSDALWEVKNPWFAYKMAINKRMWIWGLGKLEC